MSIRTYLSTPDAFTQDYCNIQDYFTGSFSQGIVKFDTLPYHYKLRDYTIFYIGTLLIDMLYA